MKRKTIFWFAGGALLIAIVVAIVLWLNANKRYEGVSPFHIYTDNTIAVVRINSFTDVVDGIRRADYANDFYDLVAPFHLTDDYDTLNAIQSVDSLSVNRALLSNIESREMFVSFHRMEGGRTSRLLAFALNSYVEGRQLEKFIAKSVAVTDTTIEGQHVSKSPIGSFATKNGCFLFSEDAHLVASLMQPSDSLLYESSTFNTLVRSMSSAPISLFLNTDSLHIYPGLTQWVELDIQFSRRNITASGFAVSDHPTPISTFALKSSKPFVLSEVLPSSATAFISYTAGKRGLADEGFANFVNRSHGNKYREAQQQMLKNYEADIEEQLANVFAYDIGLFSYSNELTDTASNCIVIKAQNGTVVQSALNAVLSTLRGNDALHQVASIAPIPAVDIPVYEAFTKKDNLFFLENMFPATPRKYYVRYENSIYLADSRDVLQRTICDVLAHRTYNSDANFMNLCADISTDNALFYFCNSNIIKRVATENDFNAVAASKFYGFALQMSGLSNLPYINAGLFYEPNRLNLPPTTWQCRLDTIINSKPYFVINHNTKNEEILVQDMHNILYLIDGKGLTIWRRQLDGPIVGQVKQIDYYCNNKLQYLFCTPTHIQLIDRNGNNTAMFPVRLPYATKVGVSYIDYGNPQDMRLFVPTIDKSVYVFDREGRYVEGWVMSQTEKPLSNPVRHFVNGDKDYLVMDDEYKVYITDRRGNTRIQAEDVAVCSTSKIEIAKVAQNAAFVSTTVDGKWLCISIPDGKTTITPVEGLGNEHHRFTKVNDNRFAIITEHNIIITDGAGRPIATNNIEIGELAEAENTAAGIVVRDKKNNLLYVFDENGKVQEGFPVPAYSPADVSANGVQIVTLGRDGMLSCYMK
ncbi:MAG: hypothetical protein J6Y72_04930 [Bacteroidales bacterium]|nr:hypothetical protein [Bacteroidales bacterium]